MALSDGVIIWDSAALDLYFRSPVGDIGRDLARRAVAVETAAKINASGRPGPNVDTGRLRSSITWEFGEDLLGIYADIGTKSSTPPTSKLGHRTQRMDSGNGTVVMATSRTDRQRPIASFAPL